MTISKVMLFGVLGGVFVGLTAETPQALAQQQRPNIVFIMGDDIGWFNIGAYHQGIMASRTPNLDKLASEGMRFTDYYAEASCTAGRANFITGELPIRTGLSTVGQAGADVGMPEQAPTIATVLRSMGYATGQFGKNHLGDLNKYLPTVHGFDEFFGYLYHLDAMEDPAHRTYPPALKDRLGPRNMIHSWATDTDDPAEQPRWGRIGKQRIEDAGPLYPKRMETVDDEILQHTFTFIDKAKRDNKPFFVWLNPTRMHVVTHLSEKYDSLRTPENGWSLSEAGFAQLDDIVGAVMKKLADEGFASNTILVFTTDNGAENFTWPDGRHLRVPKEQPWKAAFECPLSSVGRDRYLRVRSRTRSCPGLIGSQRSSRQPEIRTSLTNSRVANRWVIGPTRSISMATTKRT
jgi:arylsulfatase